VQEAFNAFDHGCDMPAEKLKMEVTLTPPHLKRFKMNVTTTVEVAEIEVVGDDHDDDASQHIIMQLAFSCISWTQRNASPHRRRRHGSDERMQAGVFM